MLPGELFHPGSVAVVGASRNPEKVGYGVFSNLVQAGFHGKVYGVNPGGGEIFGHPLYSVHRRDPRARRPGRLRRPAERRPRRDPPARGEGDARGDRHLRRIQGDRRGGGRPRTIPARGGDIRGGPGAGPQLPRPDRHARLAERLVLPRDAAEGVHLLLFPIRSALHRGARLGHRPRTSASPSSSASGTRPTSRSRTSSSSSPTILDTRVILGYVESIDDGRRFLRAARNVTPPQAGHPREGGSHRRGRARRLFAHRQPRRIRPRLRGGVPAGRRAPRGDGGGSLRPGPRVRDAAAAERGSAPDPDERRGTRGSSRRIRLRSSAFPSPEVSASLRERILPALPSTASLANPVDIIGDARADRYRDVLSALRERAVGRRRPRPADAAGDDGTGGDRERDRFRLRRLRKTVFASFLGEATVAESRRILTAGCVPNYPVPERAVRAAHAMLRYSRLRTADFPEEGESRRDGPRSRSASSGRPSPRGEGRSGRRNPAESSRRTVSRSRGTPSPRRATLPSRRTAGWAPGRSS